MPFFKKCCNFKWLMSFIERLSSVCRPFGQDVRNGLRNVAQFSAQRL
jgi:hypothetical protein